jgi:hypothetical protein
MNKSLLVLALLSVFSKAVIAQTEPTFSSKLLGKSLTLPQEKAYLSFDKPYYAVGETMWFKAFMADAMTHATDTISSVLYVDFIDEASNRLISQQKLKISDGTASGSFNTEGSQSGRLLVRAYTRWMRNLATDFHFNKVIQIFDPTKSAAKIEIKPVVENFQFFPEGGELIEGLPCNIAFKATDFAGKGMGVKGTIVDEKGETVANFADDFNGMGRFTLKPEAGKKYSAKVETLSKTFDLPTVSTSGLALTIDNSKPDLPIRLFAYLNYSAEKMPNSFTILAHQRGKVAFANQVLVKDKANFKTFKGVIPRANFDEEGIVTITIFDDKGTPIAERLVFVENKKRHLNVNLKTNKTTFNKREQVTVDVETTDSEGKPTAANVSFGVVNSDKIETSREGGTGSPYAEDLRAYMLLSSDLKGTIEQASYYFEDTTARARRALDDLLMTQGWRRFVWSEILKRTSDSIAFAPDFGLSVSGVAKRNKKPLEDVSLLVTVINKTDGNRFHYVKTDKKGRFLLNNLSFSDTTTIAVKTANLSKDYDIEFTKDKATPIVFDSKFLLSSLPSDNMSAYLEASKKDLEATKLRTERQIELATFEFKAKKKEKFDSRVTYTAEKTFEVKDGDKYGGIVFDWLRLEANLDINETADGDIYIKPFRGSLRQGKPLLIIDGSPTNDLQMLKAIFVNEVERVDINRIGTGGFFDETGTAEGMIHILTKAGNPNYYKNRKTDEISTIPSTILIGYSLVKQFYIPNYNEKKAEYQIPDNRTTVYWSPSVKTDKTGKTTVSFFTTDDAANMRILVEGLDKTGKLGVGKTVFKTN